MGVLQKTIRGIRDSLPSGFVLGRQSPGNGPPELIRLTDLAQSIAGKGGLVGQTGLSAAIDTMAGNTVGTVLTRTAQGWRAQAPTGGGGGAAGPNPFFASTPAVPAASQFTLSASTGLVPTMTNLPSGRGVLLSAPTGTALTLALMTANGFTPPAAGANFTVTACIMPMGSNLTGNWAGGVFVQDNAGKIVQFGIKSGGSYTREEWTNVGTFLASTNFAQSPGIGTPIWCRLQRVGANFVYSVSLDGENFFQVSSESATVFAGATLTSAGVALQTNSPIPPLALDVFAFTTSVP